MSQPVAVLRGCRDRRTFPFAFLGALLTCFQISRCGQCTRGAGGKSAERFADIIPRPCPLSPQVKQVPVLPRPAIV